MGARPACPVARPPQRAAFLGACPHRGCGTRQAGELGPRAVTWRLARSGPWPGANPRLLMAVASPGEASGVPFLMHVARASSWEVLVVKPEGVLTGLGPGRGGRPGRRCPLVVPLQEAGSGARWGRAALAGSPSALCPSLWCRPEGLRRSGASCRCAAAGQSHGCLWELVMPWLSPH